MYPEGGRTPPGERGRAALLTLLFSVVVTIGLAYHEPWRDELQAWMIARDSASLAELFANMRYEGHPGAWYLLLFGLSRFTRHPAAMQALHLAVATASAYLVARFAPLPWLYRGLLVFGYYFAFEYAVISRAYALGVLGLFAFCTLFPVRERRPVAVFVALAVLASTSVYGVILSLAAVSVLAVDAAVRVHLQPAGTPAWPRAPLLGAAIWLVAAGGATAQAVPPRDAEFFGQPASTTAGLGKWDAASTAARIWKAYLPMPDPREPALWGTHLFAADEGTRAALALLVALSMLLTLAAVLMFVRTPLVLLFYLAGTGGLLLFTYFIHAGFVRHDGHLFVLFVACLWLAGYQTIAWREPTRLPGWTGPGAAWARTVTVLVLLIQCVAAATMYAADLRRPFSSGRAAADFLRERALHTLPLAGSHGPQVSTVAGILDRPIYHLAAGRAWTFLPWNEAAGDLTLPPRELTASLSVFLDAAGPEAILLLGYPFDDWGPDVAATPLAEFSGAIVETETYYVYRVTRLAN